MSGAGGARALAAALALAALVGVAGVLGCRPQAPLPGPDVVAKIGDGELRYPEFESYLERTLGEPGGALASDVLSRLFDQFVDERLLTRLAVERGLVPAGSDGRAAAEALLAKEAGAAADDASIAGYYREHAEEFVRPERVRLRQILVEDRATAERARREIAAGADFVAVARRVSIEPAAARGGDQGELAREELPPAFADVIFALADGEVSAVVPADYGFHLFQVVRHIPAATVTLAEAGAEIRRRISEQGADAALARLLAGARQRFPVSVYDRSLPFAYRGGYEISRPYEKH